MEKNKEMSFEKALENLEVIVKELESGNVPLEEAIKKYSEAMELVKLCSDKLKDATDKVTKILTENGEIKDFKVEEN